MKPTLLLSFMCCVAAPAVSAQGVDWRSGPVSHTGGGTGVVLINAANDLADWLTLNAAGNGINLADPAATGTFYFGFDWTVTNNAGETGGGGFFGGLWFYEGGTERAGAGNSWTTLNLELAGPGFSAGTTPAVPYVIGTPARLVLKVKFNANADDNLTLWINPISGAGETGQTGVPIATANRNMECDSINLRTGNGTGASTLQRLMVATDFESAATWDGDNDGLPDGWERRYGIDPADDGTSNPNNGPFGDPDGDALSHAQEFVGGTNPIVADDSDNDGLLDGRELNGADNPYFGGVLGSPPGDPTLPNDSDSDNDGILDGEEVSAGTDTFVTNPNDDDTDGDGFKDGVETLNSANPLSAASIPAIPNREIIGIEYFDYVDGAASNLAGGEHFDFDNSPSATFGHTLTTSNWTILGGAPQILGGRAVTAGATIKREFNGPAEGNNPGNDESRGRFLGGSSDVLYLSYRLRRDRNVEWSGLSLYDFGNEICFIGVPSDPSPTSTVRTFGIQQSNAAVVNGANRNWTTIAPTSGTDYLVVAKVVFATGQVSLWVNPDLGQPEGSPATSIMMSQPGLLNATGVRLGSGGTGRAWFDEVVIGTTWAALATAPQDGGAGLRSTWVTAFGISNPADDTDGDSLTALQEQAAGTNPAAPDSDADGLSDSVELSGAANPYTAGVLGTPPGAPTHAYKADTDDDGIADAEEVVAGADGFITNPNAFDTDGDGSGDAAEILYGSDPTAAGSNFGGNRKLVGADDFNSYADGPAAGTAGGSGFDFDNTLANDAFIGHTGTVSDYDDVTAGSTFTGGRLATLNSSLKREFNGPGEGVVTNGDEWSGRFNGDPASADSQVLYLRADLTRGAGTTWSGISAYDFGAERTFVGVTGASNPGSGKVEFVLGAPAATPVFTGIEAVPGTAYTLVCKIDFNADLMSLWINPDLTAAEPAPTATTPFTLTNWLTAVRLGSGGTDAAVWDHLVVARAWDALGVFPGVTTATGYLAWIGKYPAVGPLTGFADDADGDGLDNGAESFLGSDPSLANAGLVPLSATGGTFVFTHSESNEIPADVTAGYEWSTDLEHWFASGADNGAGVTVTLAETARVEGTAPANDQVTVTATVTAGTANTLFARVRATRSLLK
jgi:hypothetical protein